jgi:CRISPR-associated protein Csb2
VERTVALGWGIDVVVSQCRVLSSAEPVGEGLERWSATQGLAASSLRCPVPGSLDALMARHSAFLNRLADDTFHPVSPLTTYRAVGYGRPSDSAGRSVACFELIQDDGSFYRHSQRDLIHIAGMVRHVAIETMKKAPPTGVAADWVETYVAGHARPGDKEHRQFSYLPLPSIGHRHVDPSVRRVMIAAPLGDDRFLEHLARRLTGLQLEPEPGTNLSAEPPALARVTYDKVARYYLEPSDTWASVTPVILPGHDDHKPGKARKLIEAALRQSGVEHACEFEWSSFSRFPKSLSAHKYGKDKKLAGYRRPHHLEGLTAVHLVLRFSDDVDVPGPLAIGAGRHCGLGMMAHLNAAEERSDS